ncbi:BON domain-containing protein [Desulfohalovibrio reitneri]|uniref:BON domain-containing protein n=1 Tax=Desulfohalovibrio reitneri TaxID=1307759 RepID=UPI0004A6B126|nr:BON domain-containing protein [Desulfohalovibrio reitneri]
MRHAILFPLLVLLSVPAASPASGDGGLPDERIARAVERTLERDHGVESHLMDVSVRSGVVRVSGVANDLLSKHRATRVSRTVKGVRTVVNTVRVSPLLGREDGEIRSDVLRVLSENPATEAFEVEVEVKDGRLELEGRVESWPERHIVERLVMDVEGVGSIENGIEVKPEVKRSDEEIAADVRRALKWNPWVMEESIEVEVENGEVELTGRVGSADERYRAYEEALVTGVTSVEMEALMVDWRGGEQLRRQREVPPRSDDAAIERAIADAFFLDPRLKSFSPVAESREGVVILTGTVGTLDAKRAAEQIARNTRGVWSVENHIRVRPLDRPGGEELAERVRRALETQSRLDPGEVTAKVEGGIVRLRGIVDTAYEKTLAEEAIAGLSGVIEVRNAIEVADESGDAALDYELLKDVQSELWWDPYVDSEEVDVSVEGGRVILHGEVDTWLECELAEENAYQAGAETVVNRVKVESGPGVPIPGVSNATEPVK